MMAREMKDSGIDWMGVIPKNWSLLRGKYAFRERNERGNNIELQLLSPTQKYGVIPQQKYEEYSGMKAVKLDSTIDMTALKSIYRGDFCISLRSFQGGFEYSNYNGVVSPAYRVFYPITDVVSDYYRYLFKNQPFINKMASLTKTFRDGKSISFEDFSNSLIPVPPFDEQRCIAAFLDAECAKIDAVIEQTRVSIEEYKKLKQAVITQAVTKGVRGERPMKDSGVEWIGEIPEEWTVSRVGLHYDIILGKMLCSVPPSDDYTLERYFCAANVHFDGISDVDTLKEMWFSPQEKQLYEVHNGDLLVVEGGAGAGGSAIVTGFCGTAFIQNSIMIVRGKKNSDNRYLRYLLEYLVKQGYIEVACNKATIPHFTKDKLATVPYPVTPADEQTEIADYLDKKCCEIDRLIVSKQQFITELETYKKSLIYEYVTGKKEAPVCP